MVAAGERPCFLVSTPDRFDAHHLLNPWMRWHEAIDHRRALRQWDGLIAAIGQAGGKVVVMPPAGRSGALTFTRDVAAITEDGSVIVLRNLGQRGNLEPRVVGSWLRKHGYAVGSLPEGDRLDGGNVLPCSQGWLLGIPPGTTADAARRLAVRLGKGRSVCIPLADPRFGHLDMAVADLAGRGWLVYRDGLADPSLEGPAWDVVLGGRPVIDVDAEQASLLAANVLVVGRAVIGGGLTVSLCKEIERLGLEAVPLPLDEFAKAGGGAHCLTLRLDEPG